MIIMTKENIETIVISSIINQIEDYEDLTNNIEEEYFSHKLLKKIYSFLKNNNFSKQDESIESFLFKIGLDSKKIEKLFSYTHNYKSEEIKNFFIEVYKQRLIDKGMKELSILSPEEKIIKLKELSTEIDIEISTKTLSDKNYCLTKYRNYITAAQESYENYNGNIGIPTGIPSLDEKILGLKNSEYVIVAGRPSMGKTSLVTWFFIEAIGDTKEEGVPVMFSLEMETEQIMGRMIAQMKDNLSLANTIFGKDREDSELTIEEALGFFELHDFYIEDFANEDGNRKLSITPEDMDMKLREIKKRHNKIKLIVVDYLQLTSPSDRKLNGQNEKISSISAQLKALGRKYKCPIVVLSQLNRELEKRQDKRPQLSDLRDSGSIEQDADIIMFVYRPEVYLEKELTEKLKTKQDPNIQRQLDLLKTREFSEAELIIGKQRNGPTGIVHTYFKKKNAKFGDLEEGYELDEIYGPAGIYEEDR